MDDNILEDEKVDRDSLTVGDFVKYFVDNDDVLQPSLICNLKPIIAKVTAVYAHGGIKGNIVELDYVSGNLGVEDLIEHHVSVYSDHIMPVRLTKQLLDANGFDDHLISYFESEQSDGFFVCIFEKRSGDIMCRKYIRYAHELQHMFRVCGLSELAANLKVC